jgi:hypothetical protein
MLDKFGQIDPSSSTVFVGMTLGGTWGFVLDNMFATDEGFREYLWDPTEGMRYAMGALASAKYARYMVTILFDMFFTVILFKLLFTKIVQLAGFTVSGREWIANGFVSTFISVITFKVYANMTRFEWAYPSGEEHDINQWISGQTMVLSVVIMNMVYVVAETRSRVGEPGINDPTVKLVMTSVTFFALWGLQDAGYIDPSILEDRNMTQDTSDIHLPLYKVCSTKAHAVYGFVLFICIALGCLSFVIFGTSAQTLGGLRAMCPCCLICRRDEKEEPVAPPAAPSPEASGLSNTAGSDIEVGTLGGTMSTLAGAKAWRGKSSRRSTLRHAQVDENNKAVPVREVRARARPPWHEFTVPRHGV